MEYCEDYNVWEKAMLNLFDMLDQGKIKDNHFQVHYKNDNTYVEYMVTDYCIFSVTNLYQCRDENENCYIKDIYVKKDERQKGIGEHVLKELKAACEKLKIKAIETEPINEKSADFFIKNGFIDMKNSETRRLILKL